MDGIQTAKAEEAGTKEAEGGGAGEAERGGVAETEETEETEGGGKSSKGGAWQFDRPQQFLDRFGGHRVPRHRLLRRSTEGVTVDGMEAGAGGWGWTTPLRSRTRTCQTMR